MANPCRYKELAVEYADQLNRRSLIAEAKPAGGGGDAGGEGGDGAGAEKGGGGVNPQ